MLFTKTNNSAHRDALIREANGLQLLRQAIHRQPDNPLRIPDVISVSERELAITRIQRRASTAEQQRQLGRGLALLHLAKAPRYGLDEDNYIGLNPQVNAATDDWGEFFIHRRLGYQISLIRDSGIQRRYQDNLQQASQRLEGFLNQHCQRPSLVHGDLWSGNVLFDDRQAWLIDPAVYHGDREVDLAMTEMFGGFSEHFYRSYGDVFPATTAYPVKRDIYNLYHYLNHYNLFGSAYLAGCERGWRAIGEL